MGGPTAVDVEGGAGDEAGSVAGEEDGGAADLGKLGPAVLGNEAEVGLVEGGILLQGEVVGGPEGAGAEGVDGDALRRPLQRHDPRELKEAALRSTVGGAVREGNAPEGGRDVDH